MRNAAAFASVDHSNGLSVSIACQARATRSIGSYAVAVAGEGGERARWFSKPPPKRQFQNDPFVL
jgi:hypothetical protein